MEHKRPNSEIKDVNKAELAVNEKWETPEMSVISVAETKNGGSIVNYDGSGPFS